MVRTILALEDISSKKEPHKLTQQHLGFSHVSYRGLGIPCRSQGPSLRTTLAWEQAGLLSARYPDITVRQMLRLKKKNEHLSLKLKVNTTPISFINRCTESK